MTLADHHLRELVHDSAIAEEVIAERGYRTIVDHNELLELGFGDYQAERVPGYVIPLHGVDGSNGRHAFKPDVPRVRDGKTVKYEYPTGQAPMLDVPPRCQRMLLDATAPLLICEGAKKVDAAAAAGYCAIDVWGVHNWYRNPRHGGFATIEPLDDWEPIIPTLDGRLVYIAFDSDAWTKPAVALALRRLASFLGKHGAFVYVVHLPDAPSGAKQGLDDFIAQHGAAAFAALVDQAEPVDAAGLKARVRELEQERSAVFAVLHNEHLSAEERIVAVGAVCDVEARASHGKSDPIVVTVGTLDDGSPEHRRFGLAGVLGFGRNCVARALKVICAEGSPLRKETVRTLQNGEWRSATRLTRTIDGGKLAVLRALAEFDPGKPRPQRDEAGRFARCPDHPDALLVTREVLLHFSCGCVVAEQEALMIRGGTSEPQSSAPPNDVVKCTVGMHQEYGQATQDLLMHRSGASEADAHPQDALLGRVGAAQQDPDMLDSPAHVPPRHLSSDCDRRGSWPLASGVEVCDLCYERDGTPRPPPHAPAAGRAA